MIGLNSNIKPERTKAWEVGLQANLWGEKIAVNLSLYKTSTFNQLFNPSLPSSSGYSSIYINGGQVDNRGIEASVSLNQPLGPINWNSTFTYTLNRNKIHQLLAPKTVDFGNGMTEEVSLKQMDIDGMNFGPVKVMLTEGGSIGDLYTTVPKTDEHGFVIVDYNTKNIVGLDEGKWVKAGNVNPKYLMWQRVSDGRTD